MVSTRRPKLTIEQQVEHLKSKGVTFTLCTEEQAILFLKYSTFFFKVCRIVLGGDFSDIVTRWHPMGR